MVTVKHVVLIVDSDCLEVKQVLLQEITFELMLLGSSAEPKPKQQLTGGGTLGKGPGAANSSCELLCHIARATQLPAINRSVAAGMSLCFLQAQQRENMCLSTQGAIKGHGWFCYDS